MTQFAFILTSAIIFGTICYSFCMSLEKMFGFENHNFRAFMVLLCLGMVIGSFGLYENGWHWLMLFSDKY